MDHILYWNDVALDANRRDHSNVPGTDKPSPEQGGPTLSSRALAITHLAMYDAHVGMENRIPPPPGPRYQLYNPDLEDIEDELPYPAVDDSSPAVAVAAAAFHCLTALFPRQMPYFEKAYRDSGVAPPGTDNPRYRYAHRYGNLVAQAILRDRAGDPGASASGYVYSTEPGHHRPDPTNPAMPLHGPYYGGARCFAVRDRRAHRLLPPPSSGSATYQSALEEVYSKGVAPELSATTLGGAKPQRTPEETLKGIFWAYDGVRGLGTPPRFYNQILRHIVLNDLRLNAAGIPQKTTVTENARLFAFVNAAMADATILGWEEKYKWDVWRPIVGIREHDKSMGPLATPNTSSFSQPCDPNWIPLGAPASNSTDKNFTPNFPAYPSVHAAAGAAALHIIRLFCGVPAGHRAPDTLIKPFGFLSDELNGVTTDRSGAVRPKHVRWFNNGLWQMIEENALSRIYLGIHWRFDLFASTANNEPDYSKRMGGIPLGLTVAEDIFFVNRFAPRKSEA